MSIEDPLEPYRFAAEGEWEPDTIEAKAGELFLDSWPKGERFVAVSSRRLYVEQHGEVLRIPWGKVRSVGLTRHSRAKPMRWGIALYLFGLLFFLLPNPILLVIPVTAGGILVVRGFLSKALVIQLDDRMIPPLIVPHAKWKAIGKAIERQRK